MTRNFASGEYSITSIAEVIETIATIADSPGPAKISVQEEANLWKAILMLDDLREYLVKGNINPMEISGEWRNEVE